MKIPQSEILRLTYSFMFLARSRLKIWSSSPHNRSIGCKLGGKEKGDKHCYLHLSVMIKTKIINPLTTVYHPWVNAEINNTCEKWGMARSLLLMTSPSRSSSLSFLCVNITCKPTNWVELQLIQNYSHQKLICCTTIHGLCMGSLLFKLQLKI